MINIYNDNEQAQLPREAHILKWFIRDLNELLRSHQEKVAHARSELRASQSQASHHRCAILCVRAMLWYTANLWARCIIANTSIWRKRHLVKVHDSMECNALFLIRKLWVNIAPIKLTIQLFLVTGFKLPIQWVHYALWCNATSQKHSCHSHLVFFSFLLSLI